MAHYFGTQGCGFGGLTHYSCASFSAVLRSGATAWIALGRREIAA